MSKSYGDKLNEKANILKEFAKFITPDGTSYTVHADDVNDFLVDRESEGILTHYVAYDSLRIIRRLLPSPGEVIHLTERTQRELLERHDAKELDAIFSKSFVEGSV